MQLSNLVADNPQRGTFRVHRSAMRSAELLQLEWERIFDRVWLYVGHESELEQPGDFRRRTIARRPVLFVRGKPTAYYKIGAVSYGLQAGGQSFSYELFLMNDKALNYLNKNDRWAIGSGPSVVVVDKGKAASTTSTTLTQDVYAMPFGQKGLMAGIGLEGSKITKITK